MTLALSDIQQIDTRRARDMAAAEQLRLDARQLEHELEESRKAFAEKACRRAPASALGAALLGLPCFPWRQHRSTGTDLSHCERLRGLLCLRVRSRRRSSD